MGTLVLKTGPFPEIYEDGQSLPLQEIGLRSPDGLILQYMVVHSAQTPERRYTVEELWPVGWPGETTRAGKTPKQITDSVQGSISRLRTRFDQHEILPDKSMGGWPLVKPVGDITPVDPPLLEAHRIFIGSVLTALGVVAVDTPTRALLSACKITLVQTIHRPRTIEAIIGFFQGICGSVLYSLPIAFSLFYFWFVTCRHDPWKLRFPRLYASVLGAFMGAFGGLVISSILVWAQHPPSLVDASWIGVGDLPSGAWTHTHVAFSMPWFGLWAGASVTLTVLHILRLEAWRKLLANCTAITDPKMGFQVLLSILKISLPYTLLYVFPALFIAAALFSLIPHDPISRVRIFGECLVIATGGLGFTMGFFVSLYSLTKGADIVGDTTCALTP